MHYLPPKMVCESKILSDNPSTLSLPQRDPLVLSPSHVWPPLPSAPTASSLVPPIPAGEQEVTKEQLYIREFQPKDQESARRIFHEGIKERIPSSAFRGLRYQPLLQCLYAIITVICFVVTNSFLLTCCVPMLIMGLRFYYSRKIILNHLEGAHHTDLTDIQQYYMKQPGCCFWVAILEGKVVGIVAARGNEEDNVVELRRMSVDSSFRGKGIAKALGRKVIEFAMLNHYSSIVLGTTAVKIAAHKLYESLGFKHVGVNEHHTVPSMTNSLVERMFFQLRYHRYCLQLREE
ncbi:N-acetylaspartate synthetase isoform X1 [Pelobates fuscus]|uniref:N-acetylaspartate synthetase isoform X1 n=1 Tax=Pelobates fuscus TaxID=191477 RepID=UPI002FE43999